MGATIHKASLVLELRNGAKILMDGKNIFLIFRDTYDT